MFQKAVSLPEYPKALGALGVGDEEDLPLPLPLPVSADGAATAVVVVRLNCDDVDFLLPTTPSSYAEVLVALRPFLPSDSVDTAAR